MIAENWLAPLIDRFRPGMIVRETSAALFITAQPQVVDALVTEGSSAMLTLPFQQILQRGHEAGYASICDGNGCGLWIISF